MAVRIILKRIVPKDKQKHVFPLIKEMRALATAQPGYISGETLINAEDLEEVLVISTWNSMEDWHAWLNSNERDHLMEKIENHLDQKTDIRAYFYGDVYLYR